MIPMDYIAEWRATAPWEQTSQVEQDLALSRALVEMFQRDEIADRVAFRGGTALYKLHLPPARYSSPAWDQVSGGQWPATARRQAGQKSAVFRSISST